MRHRWLVALAGALTFLFIVATSGLASTGDTPDVEFWSPDFARQLVADGWEDEPAPLADPIVVYSLRFIELNAAVVNRLGLGWRAERAGGAPLTWEFTSDESDLRYIADSDIGAGLMVIGGEERSGGLTAYDSWMATVGRHPFRVSLLEESLDRPVAERVLTALDIGLTPVQIDREGRRILTQVELDFKGYDESAAAVDLLVWADEKDTRPIAIASQTIDDRQVKSRRHFAVFLGAAVAAPESLPADSALISFGDVRGLRGLMTVPAAPSSRQPVWRVALQGASSDRDDRQGIDFFYNIDERLRFRAWFAGNQDHRLQTEHRVWGSVRFVLRFERRSDAGVDPAWRIGLLDETTLGPLQLQATVLSNPPLGGADGLAGDLKVAWPLSDVLSVFYEADIFAGGLDNALGIGFGHGDRVAYELMWQPETNGRASTWMLRIVFQEW